MLADFLSECVPEIPCCHGSHWGCSLSSLPFRGENITPHIPEDRDVCESDDGELDKLSKRVEH